jgi:Ni,Fe-hydrogenase maturation factor
MRRPKTSQTLIIGYGNPLRSDDGFGWHAGRLVARELAGQDAEVITCHQLTPELAEDIHCRNVVPQAPASSAFTHSCTPSGLLASAEVLYGLRPPAVVITVSAQSFAFGDSLSPVVSAALPKVVDQVCQLASLHKLYDKAQNGSCDGIGTRVPNTPLEKRRINEVKCYGDRKCEP